MSIWFRPISLDELNRGAKNTMSDFLEIQVTEAGDDFLKATMPINEKTRQPFGILHGGANVALVQRFTNSAWSEHDCLHKSC